MLAKKQMVPYGAACRVVCSSACTLNARALCSCKKRKARANSYNKKWNWAHMIILSPDSA